MEDKVLDEFHQKMSFERINNSSEYESFLQKTYKEILFEISFNYENYRKYSPKLLSSLETNNSHSIVYSIDLFFDLFYQLIFVKDFKTIDLSNLNNVGDKETIEKMLLIFDETYSRNSQQRISDGSFDISSLSIEDKNKMISLISWKIKEDSKQINWNQKLVKDTMIHLVFLRQLLVSLSNAELFYHIIGNFLDRLASSEYFQAGRDICEEIIISSYKDGIAELGFFNTFKFYSNTGSIHTSLFYANLGLVCILQKEPPYPDKYIKELIGQGMKLFRNVHLSNFSIKIFDSIPKELKLSNYEKRSLTHTYLTNFLFLHDSKFPSLFLDFLNSEREQILSGGINDALPLLLTLYNVKKMYPNADFSQTGFGFYLNVFESIIPPDIIKKQKDIIEGKGVVLKEYLKESLIKLNETRYSTDFVYDNEQAIKISNRLIHYSVENGDAASFFLSMLIKSDYSILFRPKKGEELSLLILPDIDINSLDILYENQPVFIKSLPVSSNTSLSLLAFSEGKVYQLQLFNKEYQLSALSNWDYQSFKHLINDDFFINLRFSESIKDSSGVRLVSPEEYIEQEKEIASSIDFARLDINENAKSFFIVKDMFISNFPHNLFLNQKGDFIAKSIPVTNVLSTEWLLQTIGFTPLHKNYSKSIWIPTENGDFILNLLNSKIDSIVHHYKFNVFNQIELPKPLSSDINIVCSHGAKNISEVQVVFQENNPTYDLDSIIGKGKILIFFVCYSGSMKTEFFKNNVTSLVKRFIAKGYDSVVAPFWGLDATIPGYWLPEFLSSIDNGLNVSEAVFNANRKVYELYPTPAAWACLHLYGNPNLRIE